jgi:Cupin-like domain
VAYTHMPASLGSSCWRRLYTDACLLRSLADVACAVSLDDTVALESIGRLDRAIVIAGAPGEGRLDLILDSITNIQSAYLPTRLVDFAILPVVIPSSLPRWLDSSSHSIPCIEPPSFGLFQKSTSLRPFIIRGYVRDWPAMQEHPWASTDYLQFVAGPGRIVPIEIGNDYRNDDWTQTLMDWDDFLTALDSQGLEDRNKHDVLYLAQHNLLKQFPALRADVIIPDYIYASLSPPVDFPGYEPPANDEKLVINAWLGPGGTVSPAHTVCPITKILNVEVLTVYSAQDPYFNFYGI